MENFILSRKKIDLEKDKIHSLSIPVSIKPYEVYFSVESRNEWGDRPMFMEFYFKDLSANSNNSEMVIVKISYKGLSLKFKPCDYFSFERKNYLFLSIRSSQTTSIELTIETV